LVVEELAVRQGQILSLTVLLLLAAALEGLELEQQAQTVVAPVGQEVAVLKQRQALLAQPDKVFLGRVMLVV
jgi:hypothetical protein